MRRIVVSLVFALLLLCSVVGLKNLAAAQAADHPVMLAAGGLPPPPIPE